MSVSYTHLDVYKRQVYGLAALATVHNGDNQFKVFHAAPPYTSSNSMMSSEDMVEASASVTSTVFRRRR